MPPASSTAGEDGFPPQNHVDPVPEPRRAANRHHVEEMDQAAYLVSDAGEVREVFYAIRDALTRLPTLSLLGALMRLPGRELDRGQCID